MTMTQAIATASGLDEFAKKEEIVLFRKDENSGDRGYVINLASIDAGKLTDSPVIADDRIVVPKSGTIVMKKVTGNVLTGWVSRILLLPF